MHAFLQISILSLLLAATLADGGEAAPAPAVRVVRGLVYAEIDGQPVRLDLHLPEGAPRPLPWLVRYSSGIETPDGNGRALLQAGYALAYADHGTEAQVAPTPDWPQFPIMVRRGIRFLRTQAEVYGLDPARAGVWGWSRGGSSALLAATCWWEPQFHDGSYAEVSDRVSACIAIAGDFRMLPADADGTDLAIPVPAVGEATALPAESRRVAAWITPALPPTLFLRGERDGDPADVRALHDALAGLGVTTDLWLKPGAGHGVGGADAEQRIVAWADRHIRTPTPGREIDPVEACIALHRVGLHTAARRMADVFRLPEARLAEVRRSEAEALAAAVSRSMREAGLPAVWRDDLRRLEALAKDQPACAALLAPLREQDDRIATTCRSAAEALRARRAAAGVWPADLPVPAWAAANGADGCGAWAELRLEPGLSLRFRWCPPGEAELGSRPDDWGCVRSDPVRGRVVIARGFYLAETEVTRRLWNRIMDDPSVVQPLDAAEGELPAGAVNQPGALDCAARLRAVRPGLAVRLPTITEWLWAARCGGVDTHPLGSGADLDDISWHAGNSGGQAHPVATRLANAWGIHDMQGNVGEWLSDPGPARPAHYRFYAAGSFRSSPVRCRPEAIGAGNGESSVAHLGLRLLIEP